ncbi:MAG: hypothetical protein AB8B97_04820 [Granulosicoccus sp.]
MQRKIIAVLILATSVIQGAYAADGETSKAENANGYPTAVIADYVLGCMAANGNSFEALHQCSCSIDYISERIPYSDYEMIETVMQVQLDRGQRGIFYRDSKWAKSRVEALQKVQAESTLRCF